MNKTFSLNIIAPFYNESANVDSFFARLQPILDGITKDWTITCIDDGSEDDTLQILTDYHKKDPRIHILHLSRNFGKEAALSAGIDYADSDAVIPIDSDLQDPPELIPDMIAKWLEGWDVVLATRKKRDGESYLKRATASLFYKCIGRMSSTPIPENTGDFRLLDKKVISILKQLKEKNRFMKGLFSWPGFKTTQIYFDRDCRAAGKSQWNYFKLWKLALDGIFSFSSFPLKVWTYLGTICSFSAFLYAIFLVVRTLLYGVDVPGYASIMAAVLFLGGIQLISLGVIGEYISRIYNETKGRPIYVVAQKWGIQE